MTYILFNAAGNLFFSFYNGYSSFNDLKINASFPISGKIKISFTYGD